MDNKIFKEPLPDAQLQRALRELPVPDPGKDFEARMLARVRKHGEPSQTARHRFALPMAMAASLLLGVLLAPLLTNTDQSPQMTASVEPATVRPLHVRLDSPVAMAGATIRVQLSANTRIQGYADVQQLEWQADIPAGANRITLPLQVEPLPGHESGGQLTVEVEYRGARKTLHYAIPPATQTVPEHQPMTQL